MPLIEKSSQEHIDDEIMIEKWANILVSSSVDQNSHPRFIQILSEITSDQAILLDRIALNDYKNWFFPFRELEDLETTVDPNFLRRSKSNAIESQKFNNLDLLSEAIVRFFSRPESLFYSAIFFENKDKFVGDSVIHDLSEIKFHLQICVSLGLLRECTVQMTSRVRSKEIEAEIFYYILTEVGRALLFSCSRRTISVLVENQEINKKIGDKQKMLDSDRL